MHKQTIWDKLTPQAKENIYKICYGDDEGRKRYMKHLYLDFITSIPNRPKTKEADNADTAN